MRCRIYGTANEREIDSYSAIAFLRHIFSLGS
jgi:hypothetical protein